MIVRIVRMHFKEEEVETFLEIFNANKESIRNFDGCTHLELLKDLRAANTYTTLSHWDEAEDLEKYRRSPLFETVWEQTKKLFSSRPEAFSLEKFIEVSIR